MAMKMEQQYYMHTWTFMPDSPEGRGRDMRKTKYSLGETVCLPRPQLWVRRGKKTEKTGYYKVESSRGKQSLVFGKVYGRGELRLST